MEKRSAGRRQEIWWLAGLLAADLLIAIFVAWRIPFQAPAVEYLHPALEFAATHQIASDFLPVGFSALGGLGAMLPNAQLGMTAVSILLSLAMIAAAWWFLRETGLSVRECFVLVALLSLYPDVLFSYNKLQDTNITALLLFAVLAALLRLRRSSDLGRADWLVAGVLGVAVTVRPNLALMILLAWVSMWRAGLPRLWWRVAMQAAVIGLIYAVATTLVHGRPFLPHNGPYNLCAGANPLTEANIRDEESTLPTLLAQHGIAASPADWGRDPDTPGIVDVRDRRFGPVYLRLAGRFIREHPGTMVKLTGMKLVAMMQPDLKQHPLGSLGGWFKVLATLALPLWLVGMMVLPHPGPPATKWLLGGMVALYLLPFLLTVSGPRFRVPLDFFCWMDLGAMVAWRLRWWVPPPPRHILAKTGAIRT